jgi:hypothetical protein
MTVGAVEFQGPTGSVTPHLALAGGRPIMSWLERTSHGHALRVSVRQDTGWETVGTIVENDSLFVNWADFPSVVAMANGTLLAHWLQKTAPSTYAYHVRMAISNDGGRSWGAPFSPHGDTSATEHGFVGAVPWNDGVAAIWLDGRAGAGRTADHGSDHAPAPMGLRFTVVNALGIPAPDLELDGKVCDCCQTDLAVTANGLVAVYRDRTDDEIRDIAITRFVGGTWSEPRPVNADRWQLNACPVNGPQVAARGDSVVVAWFTAATDPPRVSVAFSADGGAHFGAPVVVNEGRPTGRVDVAWWDGTALVSWLEETAATGLVRVRRITPDGVARPAVTVAETSTARASGFPRLAVTGDEALIAWTQPGDSGGVRVVTIGGKQ